MNRFIIFLIILDLPLFRAIINIACCLTIASLVSLITFLPTWITNLPMEYVSNGEGAIRYLSITIW